MASPLVVNERAGAVDAVAKPSALKGLGSAVLTGGSVWLASRVVLVLLSVSVRAWILPLNGPHTAPGPGGHLAAYLATWTNWDGGWYLAIAQHGYTRPIESAFFPLFPLLIRGVAAALQLGAGAGASALAPFVWSASSLLVANAAGLVALIAIALLVRQEGGDRVEVAVVLGALVAFPFAFFMAAGYTESLMVAFTALTLLFARRRSWWAAGVSAYLGALTHDQGILLAIPILWELGVAFGWWRALVRREIYVVPHARDLAAGAVAVLGAPLGTATYFGYLWTRFGSPLIRVHAAGANWGRRLVAPWTTVSAVARALSGPHLQIETLLNAGLLLLALAVLVLAVRRIPISFALYGFASVALLVVAIQPDASDPLGAVGRLLLGVLPAFLAFARLTRRRPSLQTLCLVAGALLQGVVVAAWVAGRLVE